jgi:ABC-type transport system involved in multi-copper enzyme maturation permease subunit
VTALLLADLRSRWRSLCALGGGCFVVLIALSGTYSAIGGASGFIDAFGGDRTPKLFSAFSGSADADIFSPPHFLAFGFGHPLFLVLVFTVAIGMGIGAIATDVETGRAELLFTAPVRRTAILRTRLGGWLVAETAVICCGLAGALIGEQISPDLSDVSVVVPFRVALQLASLVAFVGAVAFTASAHARSRGSALGVAVGVTAGSYVLNLVALLWSPLSFAQHLNPFGYYSPTTAADGIVWSDAAVLVGAAAVLLLAAHRALARRDLA